MFVVMEREALAVRMSLVDEINCRFEVRVKQFDVAMERALYGAQDLYVRPRAARIDNIRS